MKKIIVLLLLAGAGYWGYRNYDSLLSGPGAFDAEGKPKVLLFVMDGCGAYCADVAEKLKSRNIPFEEINASTDEGRGRFEKFGDNRLPLTVVGRKTVAGNDLPAIDTALAEVMGIEVLTPAEQQAMGRHFDEQGKPRVVVYGTSWCPYCKRMREHLDGRKIAYQYIDVEQDSDGMRDYGILRGRGYPLVFVGFRRIDGFDANKVDQVVKELL